MVQDIQSLLGLLGGLNNMQALKQPEKMFYCKMKMEDNTYCWGFLSPYDDRLKNIETKVEVTIPQHQQLLKGGQIVYYNNKIFNSDKYKLDENGDFQLNTNYEEEQTQIRKASFESQFFYIPKVGDFFNGGWYRRIPKNYASAIESINALSNALEDETIVPANILIFYTQPDYAKIEECTQEWLIAHQFRNTEWTIEQFKQFKKVFTLTWNQQG